MFNVQYRCVLNDAVVGPWKSWDDLPGQPYFSLESCIEAVEKYMRAKIRDVSLDRIGLYESEENNQWQFRFLRQKDSFRVGWLKDTLR